MRFPKMFASGMMCCCILVVVLAFLFSTTAQAASFMPKNASIAQNHSPAISTKTTTHWTNWNQYFGDPARFNRAEHSISVKNVSSLHPVWAQNVDNTITTSPVTVNGVVYVVSFDGMVGAYDALNGKKLWTTLLPNYQYDQYSAPAVDNGMVFIATYWGSFFALNAKNGKQAWSYHLSRATTTYIADSPAVANGMVYFGESTVIDANGDTNATLYALNEKTGKVAWTYHLKNWLMKVSPVVVNKVIYVAPNFDTNQLFAINATTGKLIWKVAGFTASNVVVTNNTVYGSFSDPKTQKNGLAAVNA
ncbi:MAG TPA: PQQ-binding-like beta-propeller repeat protein, partial [Ktedonobacteraceae bacterium]|nr:PQQ-binding-like beta-propeller repeat protein [Ktedonobacteraceae bacterium]